MACSVLEKQADDGFVALSCSPTDYVAVVRVPGAVNVSARIEEKTDGLEGSIRRSEMERCCVVPKVASVWIRAVFEEQPHRLGMAHSHVEPGARQLENPYSRAIASCASASVVEGFRARSSARRSFASFFRYS